MKNYMRFFSVQLFISFVLSSADVWRNKSEMSVFKIIRLSIDVDFEITENRRQEVSLVACSIHCTGSVSFFYIENNATCICNSESHADAQVNEDANGEIIYGIKTENIIRSYLQAPGNVFQRIYKQPEARDCLALFQQGYSEDGVYVIKPVDGASAESFYAVTVDELIGTTIGVWCDMTNGGWTIIQRRQDGTEDFYRNWNDYKNGFGDIIGEYWLGLDNIHLLTSKSSSLSIEMETFGDVSPVSTTVEYSKFSIEDESDNYRLTIGGYGGGGCSDSMQHHNNAPFSTRDTDNDNHAVSCAVKHTGAWWYNLCYASSLNGRYLGGADSEAGGIIWSGCWGHQYSLKRTVMKIRRNA